MRGKLRLAMLVLVLFGRPGLAQSGPPRGTRMTDAAEARRRIGLGTEYDRVDGIDGVKVAVLDTGFAGMDIGGPYLPRNAEVVEHYDPDFVRRFPSLGDPDYRKEFEPGNRHGRVMAQIVWALTGARPEGPKFYLLNANGPTMLRRAVRFAIERNVDVVLFSGSFEGGGDGDGRGPINRIVADATAADILWINAAGNYGGRVYSGPIRILDDGLLRLGHGTDIAALRFRNRVDENTVTITLTWNDYREQEDAGTEKDLDLYVEDWTGRRVGAGEKVQVSGPETAGPEETLNPRERVVLTNLPASPDVPSDPDYGYRIRVRAKRGAFNAHDRVRVVVVPGRESYVPPHGDGPAPAFAFVDASNEDELYPPADNPLVLTIGDADPSSSIGPTADRRVKPDAIVEDSRAYFSDGEVSAGSSNAAAYVAGVVAVLKADAPGLRPRHLLQLAREGRSVTGKMLRGRVFRSPDASLGFHVWRTPTRSRLAELIREDVR
jgi:hypothetical protein